MHLTNLFVLVVALPTLKGVNWRQNSGVKITESSPLPNSFVFHVKYHFQNTIKNAFKKGKIPIHHYSLTGVLSDGQITDF